MDNYPHIYHNLPEALSAGIAGLFTRLQEDGLSDGEISCELVDDPARVAVGIVRLIWHDPMGKRICGTARYTNAH